MRDAVTLYEGVVNHTRLSPRVHGFNYRLSYLVVDLGAVSGANDQPGLVPFNRPGLVSFFEADHGDGRADGLLAWVGETLAQAGIAAPGGPVLLLTQPRVLGRVFNPLSVYFCYAKTGALEAVLYEVNNTFGERHCYAVRVDGGQSRIRHDTNKMFYVSPFNTVEGAYRFCITPPGDRCSVNIAQRDSDGRTFFTASYKGRWRPVSGTGLVRLVVLQSLLGFKIIGAIHWQALRLWIKGLRLQPRPVPPTQPVSGSRG